MDSTIVEKNCSPADNVNWVAGNGECLRIQTFNEKKNPSALIVFIHGDGSRGGPSDYLARYVSTLSPESNDLVGVVLIRPGYHDKEGFRSTGDNFERRDSYTAHNVDAIASALKNLKSWYRPKQLIVAGHSGGAAITGVIIGKHPSLVDGAVLAACPCDISRWRASRGGHWYRSLSPSSYADRIDKSTRVIAIAGAEDKNTFPALTIDYVARLQSSGIDASYQVLEGVSHSGTARSEQFFSAILRLAQENLISATSSLSPVAE